MALPLRLSRGLAPFSRTLAINSVLSRLPRPLSVSLCSLVPPIGPLVTIHKGKRDLRQPSGIGASGV
jgi:hypothetical protein